MCVTVVRRWIRRYAYEIPMGTFKKLATIVRVHLEDGTWRVEAGERLEYAADGGAAEAWGARPVSLPSPPPPALERLAPGKQWYSVRDGDVGECVEGRRIDVAELASSVVVFREGLSMPKGELVRVVNAAHAVLTLRGNDEYFYLRGDFVLSAREEEALKEWGFGRPLFANSLLAAGGTLLVCFAEQIWPPAVVGTLLVAAAGYRVQGALTKVLRVRSAEWSDNLLIPSGIHGTERVVQGVLVTLVALADLLDDRVLLLTALTIASAEVVVLESVGQAVLTFGSAVYTNMLCVQLGVWALVCAGMVASVWLMYVFAGFFGVIIIVGVVGVVILIVIALSECICVQKSRSFNIWIATRFLADTNPSLAGGKGTKQDRVLLLVIVAVFLAILGSGIWAAVEGWDEAALKFSWRSLQPWRWPLFRAPDSFVSFVRGIGLWFGVVVACLFVAYVVVGLLLFIISCDTDATKPRGERTRARQVSGNFAHYHDEASIPSRKLLASQPDVAANAVASVV